MAPGDEAGQEKAGGRGAARFVFRGLEPPRQASDGQVLGREPSAAECGCGGGKTGGRKR